LYKPQKRKIFLLFYGLYKPHKRKKLSTVLQFVHTEEKKNFYCSTKIFFTVLWFVQTLEVKKI